MRSYVVSCVLTSSLIFGYNEYLIPQRKIGQNVENLPRCALDISIVMIQIINSVVNWNTRIR